MKGSNNIFIVLVVVTLIIELSYAQPKIPKGDIPSNIPSEVRGLIEGLYSSNPVARGNSAFALGGMGSKAVPALLFLADMIDDNAPLRWDWVSGPFQGLPRENTSPGQEAEKAIQKIIKDPNSIGHLVIALKDKSPRMRREAAKALGKTKDPRVVAPLTDALKDEDLSVRRVSAVALGNLELTTPIDLLIEALKDEDKYVRRDAVYLLRWTKDFRAIEPLINALEDKDWSVTWDAAEALHEITGQDFGKEPKKWQEWWEKNKAK